GDGTGAQAVAEREGDVVCSHDLANLPEAVVEEVLLMMREAPLGHDRAAAGHDPGDAARRERDVAQQDTGVNGEVVDPLLGLLDERVSKNLPRQLFCPSSPL